MIVPKPDAKDAPAALRVSMAAATVVIIILRNFIVVSSYLFFYACQFQTFLADAVFTGAHG